MDRSLGACLARHPVIATLYGPEQVNAFVGSVAEIGIVANVELRRLAPVISALNRAGKYVIVNIDSCEGLSQDKGGVEYLADIGVASLVSTRVATIQRANRAGMVTMQKVFVTDRSISGRAASRRWSRATPTRVQIMPAPMLAHMAPQDLKALPPIVASGFVCNPGRRGGRIAPRRGGGVDQRRRVVERGSQDAAMSGARAMPAGPIPADIVKQCQESRGICTALKS